MVVKEGGFAGANYTDDLFGLLGVEVALLRVGYFAFVARSDHELFHEVVVPLLRVLLHNPAHEHGKIVLVHRPQLRFLELRIHLGSCTSDTLHLPENLVALGRQL